MRGGWRVAGRVLRGLAWVVGLAVAGAVALAAAAILYARSDAGRARVRAAALSATRAQVPGLDFARVGGDYLRDLTLEDVVVRDGAGRPAVKVARVVVRFDLWPLVRKTVRVRSLELERPEVLGRPEGDGTLNLAHLTAPPKNGTGAAPSPPARPGPLLGGWRVLVDELRVDGGAANVELPAARGDGHGRDAAGGGDASRALTATGVALRARLEAGPGGVTAGVGSFEVARAEAAGAAGTLAARARATLEPDPVTGALALADYDLTVKASDVALPAALAAAADRLGVTVEAHGHGVPLAPGSRAAVAVDTSPARVRGVRIDAARLQATSDGQRWTLPRTTVRASGALLALSGHGEANQVEADVSLDIDGRLRDGGKEGARSPLPDVRGKGRLAAHVEGRLPDRVTIDATASGKRISAGGLQLGALALKARASVTGGDTAAPRVAVKASGRLAGLQAGETRVGAATLAVDARGTATPELGAGAPPRGRVHLDARDVRAGAGAPDIATLTLDATSDGRGLRVQGAARGPRVQADLAARGRLTARAADVTIERLSTAYQTREYAQKLTLARPASIRYRAGNRDDARVELDALEIHGQGYLLTGAVSVGGSYRLGPPAGGASADAPIAELRVNTRRASFNGLDAVDADATGTLTRARASLALAARVGGATVRLDGQLPVVVPRGGGAPRLARKGPVSVRLESKAVRLESLPILHKKMARQGVSGGTASVSLAVGGDIAHPTASVTFDLRDAELRNVSGRGRDSRLKVIPGVGASLRVDTKPGETTVAGSVLLRKAGVLRIDARAEIDPGALLAGASPASAPLHATVDIPRFDLRSLADFSEVMKGVEGTLTGRVEVSGTPRRLSGKGDLSVDGARVDQVAFRTVRLHGEARDGRADLTADLAQTAGGTLHAQARVEAPRPGAAGATSPAVRAHLQAKGIDVGFARPFVPALRELGGALEATADVTGTLAAPAVTGAASLQRGRVGVIGQPTFHDVTVVATLRPGRFEIGQLAMRSGDGKLEGHGWVTLDGLAPQAASFQAQAHDFLVAASPSSPARVDGDLSFEAARKDAVLSGKVQVPRAVVWLPKVAVGGGRKLQKIAPHADVRFVDAAALAAEEKARERAAEAAANPKPPTRVELRAQVGPIFIRSKDLDLEVESKLRLAPPRAAAAASPSPAAASPAPPLVLTGVVRILHGRINIQGQRYDFERGDLLFDGSPRPNPTLDIKITHAFAEATVSVQIRGTMEKPDLRLTSEPPLDDGQIVSLILTGETGSQSTGGKPFDAKGAVATMVLGRLADQLAPEIGIDVVRVENVSDRNSSGSAAASSTGRTAGGALADTRVEVGKYVSDKVYVSYAHVFGDPQADNINEVHVEYRVARRWMLETMFGDAGVGSVDALWTYRY